MINEPLGMGMVGVPERKEWIISAIGAAGALASSLFGGAASANAAKKAEAKQRASEAKENAWYNRRYNEDYVDTAAGQNLVRRAKEFAKDQWNKAAGAQAVSGGTAASSQMAKDSGNKMVADSIANIGATDQMRKAQVDDQHRKAEAQFAQMDMQREMQRAQNISNAASAASNALMSIGSAVDQASAKTTNLGGGSNNGTEIVKSEQTTTADNPTSQVHYIKGTDGSLYKTANGDLERVGGYT